jgi:hypothetical protein
MAIPDREGNLVMARRPHSVAKCTRRGGITVLSAFFMILIMMLAAFAIDIGMVYVAKAELQRTADAAALAAADALLVQKLEGGPPPSSVSALVPTVEEAAIAIAHLNAIGRNAPRLAQNPANDEDGEMVVGEMVRLADGKSSMAFQDPARFNSVLVRVRCTADSNGQLPSYFGRVFGYTGYDAQALAQAAFLQDFRGFRTPQDDAPLPLLPFAISQDVWNQRAAGTDEYSWDEATHTSVRRHDGVVEFNLYPCNEHAAGGNYGTVDIGGVNSPTPTLGRQIVSGVTRADLEYHGGELKLDDHTHTLTMSGDPGLKLGYLEPELRQIIDGKCRMIFIYSSTTRSGNLAEFTIVGFGAVEVLAVELTGSTRFVMVQPCATVCRSCIPGSSATSSYILSPVMLTQ